MITGEKGGGGFISYKTLVTNRRCVSKTRERRGVLDNLERKEETNFLSFTLPLLLPPTSDSLKEAVGSVCRLYNRFVVAGGDSSKFYIASHLLIIVSKNQ